MTSFIEYISCESRMNTTVDQCHSDRSKASFDKEFCSPTLEPMAIENPRNQTSGCWPFDKNVHWQSHELDMDPTVGFGLIYDGTNEQYHNGYSPSHLQDESLPQEINNNSERILEIENHVIDILSTKDRCTIIDIQKRLPAVTSPKCVNATMTNLEKKGLVKVLENQPPTWMKANSDRVDRRRSLNGCSNWYKTKTPLYRDSLVTSIHDGLQELRVSIDEEQLHCGENRFINEIPCRSRSISSPCLPSYHQGIQKNSKPNGLTRHPQRKYGTCKAGVTEELLHNGFSPQFTNSFRRTESQENGIVELLTQNCTSPGSIDFETKCEFDQINNGRRFSSENSQRQKFSFGSHENCIIDLLSQKRKSPESLDTKNGTEFGANGSQRLSLENLYTAQGLKQKRCSLGSLKSRRDPGIIGEERPNRTNYRRKLSPEQTWSTAGRRYSSSVYEESLDMKHFSRNFGSNSETKSCGLCKISFMTKQQSEEHFKSTKHLNKIAKVTSEPYLKFCDYCKVGLNSKSQAIEHFSSGRHEQTVAKSQKAPLRNHPPLKIPTEQEFKQIISTDTKPYDYQMELYSKAITSNSVIFLPTGTGKTLVASLVLAHLLQVNPSRQIIFLVDRVLLVLQQSDYLKCELKHVKIPVSAKNEDRAGSNFADNFSNPGLSSLRSLRIGAICGEMRKLEQGIPIFNHDILVVTADCYRNHITNGTLRFEDSALIVLDESHHCNKDHPYNVIIRDYYLSDEISMLHRPKILGLTSSPAGELTLDRTVKKMQRLLSNLGGANLLTVTDDIQELAEKTKSTEIGCRYAEFTPTEKNLLGILMEYATKCFNLAARVTEFKEYKDIFQPSSGGVLSKDDIYPILGVIDKLLASFKHKSYPQHSLMHLQIICDSICTLQECGENLACERMQELLYRDCDHGFEWGQDQGLPCENLRSYLGQCNIRAYYGNDGINSCITELLELLVKAKLERQEDDDHYTALVLVLVKRIPTATSLAKYLDSCPVLRDKGIRTMFLGRAEPNDKVMTNARQIRNNALSNIQEGTFQVVVATNIEEVTLDQFTLKLVVQMDPPNSAAALVQIRVRSRESRFIAISRDKDLGKKMKDILLRETNMLQAAEIINSHDVTGIY